MRNDNVVLFPPSVKGEAAQRRLNTPPEIDAAGRASMFPIVSFAKTNSPTTIAAEKIVDAIIGGRERRLRSSRLL